MEVMGAVVAVRVGAEVGAEVEAGAERGAQRAGSQEVSAEADLLCMVILVTSLAVYPGLGLAHAQRSAHEVVAYLQIVWKLIIPNIPIPNNDYFFFCASKVCFFHAPSSVARCFHRSSTNGRSPSAFSVAGAM